MNAITRSEIVQIKKDNKEFKKNGDYEDINFHCCRCIDNKTNMTYCETKCDHQTSCDNYLYADDVIRILNNETEFRDALNIAEELKYEDVPTEIIKTICENIESCYTYFLNAFYYNKNINKKIINTLKKDSYYNFIITEFTK